MVFLLFVPLKYDICFSQIAGLFNEKLIKIARKGKHDIWTNKQQTISWILKHFVNIFHILWIGQDVSHGNRKIKSHRFEGGASGSTRARRFTNNRLSCLSLFFKSPFSVIKIGQIEHEQRNNEPNDSKGKFNTVDNWTKPNFRILVQPY